MSYFAEVDGSGIVRRVIVADSLAWCVDVLGGTWVETSDPYAPPSEVTYCGPGYGHADNLPELFAPQWVQPVANPDGTWPYNGGEIVWHAGRLWRNVTTGVPNVWEPGVSGWHDAPPTGLPLWVQPTGAHDAYPLGAEVEHQGIAYRSKIPANTTEPGTDGTLHRWWEPFTP
jgi:hypothetical protein